MFDRIFSIRKYQLHLTDATTRKCITKSADFIESPHATMMKYSKEGAARGFQFIVGLLQMHGE
jgi:hypothetical protein